MREFLPILPLIIGLANFGTTPQQSNPSDAVQIVVALRSETHRDGRQIPLEKIDFIALAQKLRDAEPMLRGKSDLWSVTPLPDLSAIPGALLYSAFHDAYGFAATLAPDRESKIQWWQADWALAMRMICDPRTRRQYALWRMDERHPDLHWATKLGVPFQIATGHIPGIRLNLKKLNALPTDNWGIIHGISWISSPNAVLKRGEVPFIDTDVLRRIGFNVQHVGGGVHVEWQKRLARFPISSKSSQFGYRELYRHPTGRTYVPALELHRQGVVEIQVLRESQMLDINYAPPAESDRNVELPFRRPLP